MAKKMEVLESYLDEVCTQVRCRKAHAALREELRGHIEEKIEGYLAQGMDAEEAARRAVAEMGDSVQVGKQLDQTHRPQVDWRMLALVALFAAAGTAIMVVLGRELGEAFQSPGYLVVRFAVYLVIGLGVMLGLMFVDYSKLQRHPMLLYWTAAILLVVVGMAGVYENGRAYFNFGFFTLSPMYLVLPLFVTAFAGLLANYRGGGAACIGKLVAAGTGSILLMLAYPSLAGAVMLLACYAVMLTVAVAKRQFSVRRGVALGVLYGGGALLVLLAVLAVAWFNEPYRLEVLLMRLTAFCNFGAADPGGSGYMYAISRQWLAASGLFGAAQGMALPLSQTLPAAHTDYVLVSTIATFGWVAGAGILVLASALIGRIVQVGRRAKTGFGNTLCIGVGALLAAKFLFCIFANLGLLPMLSFGLPFLSYGGTEYVSNLALVGLVLSVWRHNNLLQPSAPPPRPRHTRWFRYEDGELVIRLKEN